MMSRNQRGGERMSNKQQTAVELLWEIAYYNGMTDEIKTKDELLLDAEHYYNETYGEL